MLAAALSRAVTSSACRGLVFPFERVTRWSNDLRFAGCVQQSSATRTQPGDAADIVRARPQIRLLSGSEFRATVQDLLGVEVDAGIVHADLTTGFDTGAGATLDQNVFSMSYGEVERVADVYERYGRLTRGLNGYGCPGRSSGRHCAPSTKDHRRTQIAH